MRRTALIATLLASLLLPGPGSAAAAPPARPRTVALAPAAFHGFRLGRGGFGRRRTGFGTFGRRTSARGWLHSIARALAFAYIFHLFVSHGGLSILLWLLVIAFIAHLFRRRRRLRDRYSY